MTHAATRAVERYGRQFDLAKISRMVRSGRAKFYAPTHDGCTFYDVPYEEAGSVTTVRVLMNADNKFVITVVPPQSANEVYRERGQQIQDSNARRKRAFFRGFQDDEEDCVTA